jgi:hypothetical protein
LMSGASIREAIYGYLKFVEYSSDD